MKKRNMTRRVKRKKNQLNTVILNLLKSKLSLSKLKIMLKPRMKKLNLIILMMSK
jgi:hypothetical protein